MISSPFFIPLAGSVTLASFYVLAAFLDEEDTINLFPGTPFKNQ